MSVGTTCFWVSVCVLRVALTSPLLSEIAAVHGKGGPESPGIHTDGRILEVSFLHGVLRSGTASQYLGR